MVVSVPSTAAATTTAHTVIFGATDDSYTSAAAPTSNFGSSTVLSSGSAVGGRQVTYLKFYVTGLPATMSSITATLRLTRTAHHLPATISANSVPATGWTESSIMRVNEPKLGASIGTVTATTTTALVAFTTRVATNGVYAFAVTTLVTTNTARFNSSESAGAHPTLTINYTATPVLPPPPPPQPPPASSGIWVGAAANVPNASITTFDAQNSLVGPLKVRRSFNNTLPATFARSSGGQDAAHGYRSFVSWKPPGGDFVGAAAGTYDAAITAWARSVPTTGVYATAFHEPENDMTGPQFVAMQRHLYTVVKAANPSIQWGPVYTDYWWRNPAAIGKVAPSSPQSWNVGSDREDFVAVDNYAIKPTTLATDPQFLNWYSFFLGATAKPMLITEYGQYAVPPGGSADPAMQTKRAQVIAADASWIKAQGKIKMWLYWDGTGAQGDWSLTDAASRQAWKNVAVTGRTS